MININLMQRGQPLAAVTDNTDKGSCSKSREAEATQGIELPIENLDTSGISKDQLDEITRMIKPFKGTTEETKLSVISDLVRYAKEHPCASTFISAVGGFLTGYIVEKHMEATSLLDQIKDLQEKKESLSEKKKTLKENIAARKNVLISRVRQKAGMDMIMGAAGGLAVGGLPVITMPVPVPWRLAVMALSLAGGAAFGLLFRTNLELKYNS
ncbi:MAG: hypothetical protein AB2L14_06640 [Candidatus Xenobiia bacterium LiM19]